MAIARLSSGPLAPESYENARTGTSIEPGPSLGGIGQCLLDPALYGRLFAVAHPPVGEMVRSSHLHRRHLVFRAVSAARYSSWRGAMTPTGRLSWRRAKPRSIARSYRF